MFTLYCQLSGSTNQFVNVEFDLLSSSVHCVFKQQTSSTEKLCNIVYGPGEQCTNLSQSSSSQSNGLNSVDIDYRALPLPSVYCFVLTAYDGTFSASIEGTFTTGTIFAVIIAPQKIIPTLFGTLYRAKKNCLQC